MLLVVAERVPSLTTTPASPWPAEVTLPLTLKVVVDVTVMLIEATVVPPTMSLTTQRTSLVPAVVQLLDTLGRLAARVPSSNSHP